MGSAQAANPPIRARVVDLTHDGRGVAREQGKALFIAGALPEEEVLCRVVKHRRDYDEAELIEILQASPHRVQPRCEHFGLCGGCSLQHLSPDAQRHWKEKVLFDNLQRLGHVQAQQRFAPLSAQSWGYRRKARLGAKYVYKKQRVLVGFREKGKRYIADLKQCEVLVPEVGRQLPALAELIAMLSAHRAIPQIEIAQGDERTALVIRHLQALEEGDRQRLRGFAERYGFVIYLQPGGPDSIEALDPPAAALRFRIDTDTLELLFEPTDFVQVNRGVNEQMIQRVMSELAPTPDDHVLELFSGLGNFTLPLARRGAMVTAVEGDAALVERARHNAQHNGLDNIHHYVADLAQSVEDLPWAKADHYDKILLDPPRSGALESLPVLARLGPRRIVYVSCNPATLARDADRLVNHFGYVLKGAGIMDMFPHTAHVESMAVFEIDR